MQWKTFRLLTSDRGALFENSECRGLNAVVSLAADATDYLPAYCNFRENSGAMGGSGRLLKGSATPPLIPLSASLVRQKVTGFTYIELAIVVAVVAILALITMPSYLSSIEKTRRVEGKILLDQTMAAEERHYSSSNRYSGEIGTGGLGMPEVSQAGYYRVSAIRIENEGQYAEITVSPQGAHARDPCGDLILDSTGRRSATGQSSGKVACW